MNGCRSASDSVRHRERTPRAVSLPAAEPSRDASTGFTISRYPSQSSCHTKAYTADEASSKRNSDRWPLTSAAAAESLERIHRSGSESSLPERSSGTFSPSSCPSVKRAAFHNFVAKLRDPVMSG